jgi:YbgC/YbaW family acyl-CoA thioester hydrolase
MPAPFRTSRVVEFGDTDMAGIVHFANFFRFMEAAEHAYLRACGLSVIGEWEGERVSFPRVAASCDYLKPARFQEVLDVTVAVARLGRSSVTYAFEFFRGGELLARGQITAVFCRVRPGHEMEPQEIPGPIRARLERGPGDQGGQRLTPLVQGLTPGSQGFTPPGY